jgi:hypothetical protein
VGLLTLNHSVQYITRIGGLQAAKWRGYMRILCPVERRDR